MKIQKRKQMLIITAVSLACVLTTGYILDLSSARQTKAEILTAEEQAALETDLSDPSEAETENVTEMENVAEAEDLTGATPEELYELVSEGTPVIVWCTIGMADRGMTRGWYTETGEYVDWATNDHGAILIGYTPQTVIIADPISGQIEYDREQFESVFASRSGQCVILSAEEN